MLSGVKLNVLCEVTGMKLVFPFHAPVISKLVPIPVPIGIPLPTVQPGYTKG